MGTPLVMGISRREGVQLAGLVRGRREGTYVHYSAADTQLRALLAEALFHAGEAARDTAGSSPGS